MPSETVKSQNSRRQGPDVEPENAQAPGWLIYGLAAGRAMLRPPAPAGGEEGSLQGEQTLKS